MHTSDIAFRPAQAGDDAKSDRVVAHHEDDWDRRCRRLGRECRNSAAARDNDGYRTASQVCRQCRESIILTPRPSILNRDVAPLDVADFAETPAKPNQVVHEYVG